MLENNNIVKDTTTIIEDSLPKAISYEEYRTMVAKLVEEKKATGIVQTEALTNYTMLNDKRMKRLDKTTKFSDEAIAKIEAFNNKVTWLVLTESWCGDAAQTMPVMNKMANLNDNIDFKVVLRDENTELMNLFLTNGGMSIPKLVMLDSETNEVLGDWGPRPSEATKMVEDYKNTHGTLTPEFKKDLQMWYTKDKGQNTLNDILTSFFLK
ncbi:thioredoxin family protein [Cellulophaga baltica]|uniref:thioredoxin family protein n=1 Tax=Cellulophaga TaxID=104264 RepID=UPI001C069B8A|nr:MULTISPECIES: thioredoxin family protein [Cellulophaga]MBU2995567.1 thioredoxin family protein [Cellulophaga baltica]MDO6766961.1 thioredoxin family protein [Cellulophaga sp. 1_MG-2023]